MEEWVLTDSSGVHPMTGDPLSLDQQAACMEAAGTLPVCVNTCNPEPMVAKLAEDVSFDSQNYAGPISGKSAVAEHFRDKFNAIVASRRHPVAEVGWIDGEHKDQPGVIIHQAGAVRTFWSPSVHADGLIFRIFGYTLVPHPSTARGTGERPGFDDEAHRKREALRLGTLRDEFATAEGSVTFRGFALDPAMVSETLEPLLVRLLAAFPGSKSLVSVHTFNGSHEEVQGFAEEARAYDVTGYPAVAVEKGGRVFRGASESQSFGDIASFVEFLFGSRRAQGYAVAVGTGEPDQHGWVEANLLLEMHQPSEEFARCWQAAGRHIEAQAQGSLDSWLKVNLNPPFLQHLSFRLGNQLFFIRIEDVDGKLEVPGSRNGLLYVAEGCKGHPCLMPMKYRAGEWKAEAAGWGLVNARTGKVVDPIAHVSDERIEMTDWEVQDFAVQVVRDHLEKAGRKLMSWQGNPAVDPSIWFVGDSGPEWVVVRAVRYPKIKAHRPANWQQIAARCAELGKVGHFASVSAANADDAFDPSGAIPPEPLWRGHRMLVRFEGLETG
jgi:hypothetical protein